MAELSLKQQRESIVNFYIEHKEKGKSFTCAKFKKEGVARSTIYSILRTFEERKTTDRKTGSGRASHKVTSQVRKRLVKAASDKAGVSSRKLAGKFGVCASTVSKVLREEGIKYLKRLKAPATIPGQEERQRTRCRKLSRDVLPAHSSHQIIMDDESYFSLKGDHMPGNSGYYSAN